jgi:hypothetical protein
MKISGTLIFLIILVVFIIVFFVIPIIVEIFSESEEEETENDDSMYLCANVDRYCIFYDRGKCNSKSKCRAKYIK